MTVALRMGIAESMWNVDAMDILLVEDNPGDARLAAEAFKEGTVPTRLHVVQDGIEAMSFLRRQGGYGSVPRPHLVLLDLNLPRKDGREVLAEIKDDPNLCRIPVIVLTTSQAESDINRSYELHANCYIVKPVDFDRFIDVVKGIEDFWCSLVKLPPLN
jgi:CheY-like chemotaxis protein